MVYKLASKRFFMSHNVTCIVEVPVPDLAKDPNQAEGLGKSCSEKNEKLDEFLTDMLYPQYTRAMKAAIDAFIRSKLPTKFLYRQQVLVSPLPVYENGVRGFYDNQIDLIGLDSDSFSIGFLEGSGEFLYGHENGHRIIFFRSNKKADAISEIKSILSISDDYLAEELLCDAFGYLMNENGKTRFDILPDINRFKREGMALTALKLAWSL